MSDQLPSYQELMLPLLRHAGDIGKAISVIEIMPHIAKTMGVSAEQMAVRLASGKQGVFHNRLSWAKTYLTRANLLQPTKYGYFEISELGRARLSAGIEKLDLEDLLTSPEFKAWKEGENNAPKNEGIDLFPTAATNEKHSILSKSLQPTMTPEERIYAAQEELESALKAEILDRVREMPPSAFEELIITLLLKMGYGQGRQEMAIALGGSGDGGVDGVVHQDPLGLDRVYIQAKRNAESNKIGPSLINSFIGALNIKRANKGLFVTSSSFTDQAKAHARGSTTHVVLIDGPKLADLMVAHSVGVMSRASIEIKVIDETFFEE